MNLPEDRWWNTTIPLQHHRIRLALRSRKRGLIGGSGKVVCLFPVKSSKVVKGWDSVQTLILTESPRNEDRVDSLTLSPIRYLTYPVGDMALILRMYPNASKVSIDVRWVSEGDELNLITKVLCTLSRKVTHLHFCGIPNSIERKIRHIPIPKGASIQFEFQEEPRHKGRGCLFL